MTKKLTADDVDEIFVRGYLRTNDLSHIKIRKRGDTITLYKGTDDDKMDRVRLKRVTLQWWTPEMPHGSVWEKTPFRGTLMEIMPMIKENFYWLLAD